MRAILRTTTVSLPTVLLLPPPPVSSTVEKQTPLPHGGRSGLWCESARKVSAMIMFRTHSLSPFKESLSQELGDKNPRVQPRSSETKHDSSFCCSLTEL